jgi:hypothetical protein
MEKIRLEREFMSNILVIICLLNITDMRDIPYNPSIEGLRPYLNRLNTLRIFTIC